MPQTTATFDEVLKDVYEGDIRELIPTKTKVLDMFLERPAKDWGGRTVTYPAMVARTEGVGWGAEEGALPTAGNEQYQSWRIPMRYLYGRVRFSAQAMKASEGNRNAFGPVMEREMRGMTKTLQVERARALMGDGRGILCLVNGASTGATVTVDAPGGFAGSTNGARFLRPGMRIGFVNPATGALRSGIRTVVSKAANGNTVTIDSAFTATDNDYIVRAMTTSVTDVADTGYQKESMGLSGLVDDGTYVTNYHNINRTSYPIAGSYVLGTVGGISADVLQRAIDVADQRGDGEISDLVMHPSVRRAYLEMTEGDRRYQGGDLSNPDAGTKAAKRGTITFGGIPITAEKYAPYGVIFGIDRNGFYRYTEVAGEWADEDGAILARAGVGTSGVDSFEAYYRVWDNFQLDYPAANFRLDGVSASVVVVSAD